MPEGKSDSKSREGRHSVEDSRNIEPSEVRRFNHQLDPERYVRENQEILVRLIIHGTDDFVRSLALAALIEYGPDPDIEHIKRLIDGWSDDVSV